jgi:THO complex subunit 1 transcription elongation factor
VWSNARNKGIHPDFTLEPQDAQWVQETQVKCIEELKQTAPNGRGFAEAVVTILEREKNWVRWKNEFCAPFDKDPWHEEIMVDRSPVKVGFEMATKKTRRKMMEDPPEWEHKFGSAPLTEIWEMGYKEISDLQRPFQFSISVHLILLILSEHHIVKSWRYQRLC